MQMKVFIILKSLKFNTSLKIDINKKNQIYEHTQYYFNLKKIIFGIYLAFMDTHTTI